MNHNYHHDIDYYDADCHDVVDDEYHHDDVDKMVDDDDDVTSRRQTMKMVDMMDRPCSY